MVFSYLSYLFDPGVGSDKIRDLGRFVGGVILAQWRAET
jgi:hypothetical protein